MSDSFRLVETSDVNGFMAEAIESRLSEVVSMRLPGHCMRVGDLDSELMVMVARKMQARFGGSAQIHVLAPENQGGNPLFITSTKLVELRNPLPGERQRPPLMVFVPNEMRASAEDSFSEATFETISLHDTYQRLQARLISDLPNGLQTAVPELLGVAQGGNWRWANPLACVRLLLNLKLNEYDPEVVGAALFELGLVPDLRLLEDPTRAPHRIARNLECVRKLAFSTRTERGRVLELGLASREFAGKLAEALLTIGSDNPAVWTKRLLLEKPLREFTFDKWQFESGEVGEQKVCVRIVDLGVAALVNDAGNNRLSPLIGQRVLIVGRNGQKNFRVKFACDPHPERARIIDHFRIQVISRESGPMGLIKKKERWETGKAEKAVTFGNLGRYDWEEGWHFIRVLAFTATGDPVPLVDDRGQQISASPQDGAMEAVPAFNESEPFYVLKSDDYTIEPAQAPVAKLPSLAHALLSLKFTALADNRPFEDIQCKELSWIDESAEGALRSLEILELHFGREGFVHIAVARVLRIIERRILKSADSPISWRLRVASGYPAEPQDGLSGWPDVPAAKTFLECREAYFMALRGADGRTITQAADLTKLRPEIVAYGESYLALLRALIRRVATAPDGLKAAAVTDLQKVLALDTVDVDLADHRGESRHAVLVGPTHPLRAVWLSAWGHLGQNWLSNASKAPREYIGSTRDSLLSRLSLIGFPAFLPVGAGRLYSAIDNIHPFWTLYAATTDPDPRGLVAEVCTALALPEPSLGSFNLTGSYLADRIQRYLVQHPYVQTLVINCLNAGRGKVLADMLLNLQRANDLRDLRYDIRIFVPDPDLPGIGDDLGELISPSSSITAQEADPFNQPSGRLLSPKLSYSVRSVEEYSKEPERFSAHITFLFDVFPAQEVGAVPPTGADAAAPIHGLLQDFSVTYNETGDTVSWQRCPRHATARPIEQAEDLSHVLGLLATMFSSASATVATQDGNIDLRPLTRMVLSPENKALLHQVHEFTDWVFTVDRNLGIEFFDNSHSVRRPEYLIDHSPDISSNSGRRVVVTSRSLTEIEALFGRALEEYELGEFRNRSGALLTHLRALSGRLALKLLSSPTQRAEALGLSLAKVFLENLGALRDQVVVPLDAHLELFRSAQRESERLAEETSLRRTDLALFDLNARERLITCNLVEVKCYRNTGSVAGFARLRETIAEQIGQSDKALRMHFDPDRSGTADRADRVVKTQEFMTFLEFYTERAARLGLLGNEAKQEAQFLLRHLEDGYRLRFTRSAVVFDFDMDGADDPIEEHGIEFHRIGRNVVREMIEAMPRRDEASTDWGARTDSPEPQPKAPTDYTATRTAAFLPRKRDRSVTWDSESTSTSTSDPGSSAAPGTPPPVAPAAAPPSLPATAPPKESPEAPMKRDARETQHPAEPLAAPALNPNPASQSEKAPKERETPPREAPKSAPVNALTCDILLGTPVPSPQFGVFGKFSGRTLGLDLNQTHTISVFGVQGGGKSYTVGSVLEMALRPVPGINQLPKPLGAVVFHYSQTQDYKPEFTSMRSANDDADAIATLLRDYKASPAGLDHVILLTSPDKVAERKGEYPNLEVLPLKFASAELQATHWRFLMGAVGNQAAYIRQLTRMMREKRNNLTLEGLKAEVEHSDLSDSLKKLARMRLEFASTYIDDAARLGEILKPGRLVIVDLRDEFLEKDEALGLFVVLLQIFAASTDRGERFNKVVVFDEAHKYIQNEELIGAVVEVVREMRHKGTSILVASQDPLSVPLSLIELSSTLVLHRFNSPGWLKHIQKAVTALAGLTPEQLGRLLPGEAYLWAKEATDPAFTREALKVIGRPRFTKHGGSTKTAM